MIEHLRGRDRKLEPLGWTGPDAEWIALVCLHSGVFTRAQFCDYFDTDRQQALSGLLRHWCSAGRRSRTKTRSMGEELDHAAYRATRSTGRWELRTSATGEGPASRLSCGGFCRWILCWNIPV